MRSRKKVFSANIDMDEYHDISLGGSLFFALSKVSRLRSPRLKQRPAPAPLTEREGLPSDASGGGS
jgi:hypothetical protein